MFLCDVWSLSWLGVTSYDEGSVVLAPLLPLRNWTRPLKCSVGTECGEDRLYLWPQCSYGALYRGTYCTIAVEISGGDRENVFSKNMPSPPHPWSPWSFSSGGKKKWTHTHTRAHTPTYTHTYTHTRTHTHTHTHTHTWQGKNRRSQAHWNTHLHTGSHVQPLKLTAYYWNWQFSFAWHTNTHASFFYPAR